ALSPMMRSSSAKCAETPSIRRAKNAGTVSLASSASRSSCSRLMTSIRSLCSSSTSSMPVAYSSFHSNRGMAVSSRASVACKVGFFLAHERLVGALVVLGLHADRLRLRLGLDRIVDAHAPFLVDAALGHGVREGRTGGERFCHALRIGQK